MNEKCILKKLDSDKKGNNLPGSAIPESEFEKTLVLRISLANVLQTTYFINSNVLLLNN